MICLKLTLEQQLEIILSSFMLTTKFNDLLLTVQFNIKLWLISCIF